MGTGQQKGRQELGPGGLGGGAKNLAVTACVSGTELRSLDPEKGGCFAVHLHLAMTGAELAAVSALLSHVIKLTQSFLTLDFAHGETEMYPGIGNKSLEAPLPLVRFSASQAGWGSQRVSTSRKQGKRTPEGLGDRCYPWLASPQGRL